MLKKRPYSEHFSLYFTLLLLPFQAFALSADMPEVTSGTLMAKSTEGVTQHLPMVKSNVDIKVTGPIARTTLSQVFKNPGNDWLEAVYAFPLPEKAAVDHLDLVVGERVIQGQIKEKRQARAIYKQASQQGKKAALVEQHRPNLFTTSVTNIPPRGEVEIRLQYQQQLAWRDRGFSLRYPMAITPRYVPADQLPPAETVDITQQVNAGWSILPNEIPNVVPLNENISTPGHSPGSKTTIRVILNPGFPVENISSRYHRVKQSQLDQQQVEIQLVDQSVEPDRDFVLEWHAAAGHSPRAAFFKEQLSADGQVEEYGLLMVMPPEIEQSLPVVRRETIFIIDTSGSMGGDSIRQAKQALDLALRRLKTTDSFNIIAFNDATSTLFAAARQANDSNRRNAIEFVDDLEAGGGTDMMPALQTALRMKNHDKTALQQVIFITDGAVGNEAQLLAYIYAELGQRRLFTVGIGSAPNSYFMKEAAYFGRGTYSFIGSPGEVKEKMQSLFNRIEKPVLTQLSLVTDSDVEILPQRLPDLYAGEPLAVAIKINAGENGNDKTGLQQATLKGRLGQAEWQQRLSLNNAAAQTGLSVHWGREAIQHWMRSSIRGGTEDEIKAQVLRLALKHHLVSQYTSLVAVDVTPSRPLDATLEKKAVQSKMPAGFSQVIHQPVLMASGATHSRLLMIVGMLLLVLSALYLTRPDSVTAQAGEK